MEGHSQRFTMTNPLIQPADMCKMHQSLLVHQTGFGPHDTWRSLIIMAQIALFQAATADDSFYDRLGGDISRVAEVGCLACFKPDKFGEIVDIVQRKGQSAIKELGESWLKKE